jgi:hypothetical protein
MFELESDVVANLLGVDPVSLCARAARVAKAEPEQEAAQRSELNEVALVVETVNEAMVVKRFRDYRSNSFGGHVASKCTDVRPHVWIGGTEIGEECVAESVLASAFGVGFSERVVVKKDCPGSGIERSFRRLATQVSQNVGFCGQPAHVRLKEKISISPRVRLKEDRPSVQKAHLPHWVVGKDISAMMVCRCHCHAARACPTRNVFQNRFNTLVPQIGGEREERGLDRRGHSKFNARCAVVMVASIA